MWTQEITRQNMLWWPLMLWFILINVDLGVSEVEPLSYSEYQPHFHDRQLPRFLQVCHRRHKRFNLCVKTSLQSIFDSIRHGSKEFDLPPTEPLYAPELDISQGSGDVALNLKFHHVSITGLGRTKVITVRSNLEDNKLEITLKYPYLNFTGDYTGNGSIKTFPILGHGQFYLNMSDVSAAWIIYFLEPEGRHNYLQIDNFIIDIIPVEISGKFGTAIDENSALGTNLNEFFNENAQEIFKIGKPKITEALAALFTELANKFLSRYSAETLLPP